ncbi:MAG: cytochrome c-type biogenesis protein CcmH [Gammaproteobacteria bacterium]|nr:cytochrome c-type biogenesis protein CcmH [Gammaproteobacteria bacterium]
MRTFKILMLLGALSGMYNVYAGEAQPMEDPAIEDRFKKLTLELRCLKCQNQTIYDSKAGLAEDLRAQIRDQIHQGKSDQDIVDYMVARYGNFVRYRPPMTMGTFLLWVGPFLLFGVGIGLLIYQMRKRRQLVQDGPLDEQQHRRAQSILRGEK